MQALHRPRKQFEVACFPQALGLPPGAGHVLGREDVPAPRMSFRLNFSQITGITADRGQRPMGQGTPEQVAEDMQRYRKEAGLEAFQINFNGCHNLGHLLDSMDLFMQQVRPLVDR